MSRPRPGLGVAAGTRRLGDRLPAFPEGTKGYCSVGDGVPSSPCGLLLAFCVQDMAAPPRGCPPSPPCPAPCSPWLRGRPVHPLCLPEVLVVSKRPSSGACPLSTHRLPWVLLGPAGRGTEWSAAWMGHAGQAQPPRTPRRAPLWPTAANAPAPGPGVSGERTVPHLLICFLRLKSEGLGAKTWGPGALGTAWPGASIPPREPSKSRSSVLPGTWERR